MSLATEYEACGFYFRLANERVKRSESVAPVKFAGESK
jgi:hypothetical protein